MRIIGSFVGNVECKRFYMPGIKAFSVCPKCKEERELDFKDQYLSYPVVNRFQNVYFFCEPCNTDWEEEVKLEVSLKAKKEGKPMKLRELRDRINKLCEEKENLLDLEVHLITEIEGLQQEQICGGIAVPTLYTYKENEPKTEGIPQRIVIFPEDF